MDNTALFNLSYGVYVVTAWNEGKPTGCTANSAMQITSKPATIAVSINHDNYTNKCIKDTGVFAINILGESVDPMIIGSFGFRSGKDTDKFEGLDFDTTANGLALLKDYVCAVISLKVESTLDLDTHVLFVCRLTDAKVLSDEEPMTYAYYHKNVKPKPQKTEKKSFVCKICGYVYEGEALPEDFICPWCKHGAADFEEQ